jgi:beta-mannosidase
MPTTFARIDLSGLWKLSQPDGDVSVPMTIPGDVHATLYAQGKIPDPYFGANEELVQWVADSRWTVERSFFLDDVPSPEEHWTLSLHGVDVLADIWLNGQFLGRAKNQFRRHRFVVSDILRQGENSLRLEFANAFSDSQAMWEAHPFEMPYARMGYRRTAINFLRKTQCAAGWDWNICLMPVGIYGDVSLVRTPLCRIEHVEVGQEHRDASVDVTVAVTVDAVRSGSAEVEFIFNGHTFRDTAALVAGVNTLRQKFHVNNPRLWWPAGQGDQPLYTLTVTVDGEAVSRRVGLRTLELITEDDEIGQTMKFRVNGRDVFAKGANWIPGDAMPSRITPEAVLPQLQACVQANMNMLRIWGGGQFEADWFYDACDELGLMLWHDFMFACMHYPSDRAFLKEVRAEVEYQVRRLSHHASVALWCGDNEIIGAMGWYDVTKNNRDRYIVNYDRLNRTLEEVVEDHDPARRFWPSSPSMGPLDFSDGWHVDTRGDLHFWEVWHSAKPFEHYRTVKPRFCSEFGFQSFPSMKVIESFTNPEDRNVSSPVMETHQRNKGGNARMVETMTRYFRFPSDFAGMIYLSQVQQGLAMQTAIDYWRSLKPRCMGTLYWQVNDTWPVASWSSLEYGGGWKLLHYMAARFFAPVRVVAVPDDAEDATDVKLVVVSDVPEDVATTVIVEAVHMGGAIRLLAECAVTVPADRAVDVWQFDRSTLAADEFVAFRWVSDDGRHMGDNEYLPRFYKEYALPTTAPTLTWFEDGEGPALRISAPQPCFFVRLESATGGVFSDNGFTLLPGRPRVVRWRADVASCAFGRVDVTVRHLAA